MFWQTGSEKKQHHDEDHEKGGGVFKERGLIPMSSSGIGKLFSKEGRRL